jgi:hypothetical protein
MPIEIEQIADEDKVYRLVAKSFYSEKKQRVGENAFSMRSGEDGLSVDWNKNNTPEQSLERVNKTYKHNQTIFKSSDDFLVYEIDVAFAKSLEFVNEIKHDPIFNDPEMIGIPNNPVHALIINTKDEEVRVKLRDHARKL